jgi:hypothetical protein
MSSKFFEPHRHIETHLLQAVIIALLQVFPALLQASRLKFSHTHQGSGHKEAHYVFSYCEF